MIVRYPTAAMARSGGSSPEAAGRLAAPHRGAPVDDTLLLPFLYLHRHAIELDLKRAVCFAARLRRKADETDPTLSVEAVTERSKNKPPIDNPRRRT
jgi:hypothetical protein